MKNPTRKTLCNSCSKVGLHYTRITPQRRKRQTSRPCISCRGIRSKAAAPEPGIWRGMINRCSNSSSKYYHRYGGRGIKVCRRWKTYANFLEDMGRRPTPKHSIDRVNNDKGYSKKNCRWATSCEQNRNRSDNRLFTLKGITKTVAEWAKEMGIAGQTITGRSKRGWSDEHATTTPTRNNRIPLEREEEIRRLRAQDLTIPAIAERVGCSPTTVWRYGR